jgi:geranylgeranyl pyrophosphate synthase
MNAKLAFPERIKILKQRIEEEIRKPFQDREPEILYRPMFHLLEAGGKRIRPLLLILSCQSVGGCVDDCFDAGLAVEILHTFTLVHDDIMDHGDIRRGRPTVHKKWDESTAILAGDGLVTLAYQMLLKTEHPQIQLILRRFTSGLLILCEGQALDKKYETQDSVSIEEYENMIEKKTAKLIEVACEVGAILGNGTNDEITALKGFALFLGKAFQIQDDLLDILSDEEISGKPLGSDLIEKKKTYPTIHFLNNGSLSSKERFQELWVKEDLGRDDVLQIRDLFEQEETFQAAQEVVRNYISRAVRYLEVLKPEKASEDLKTMARMIQERVS